MSAQIIAALRRRADILEAHGQALAQQGITEEQDVTLIREGKLLPGRPVRFMLNLATEFRLLADEAEGRTMTRDEVLEKFAPPGPTP